MKILVTGKQGQLGYALKELSENHSEWTWRFTDRSELNIMDSKNIQTVLKTFHPDWIINAAAYTDVDGAEDNEKLAFKVNADGPYYLAKAAQEIGAKLVHVSTDYVFDGTKKEPYTETDEPNPLQVYGKSKLRGEILIQQSGVQGFIIRTSWVYGHHGNNFVKTILHLAKEKDEIQVVDDQIGCPTYVNDLAETILETMKINKQYDLDVLHYSNIGSISWCQFAKYIVNKSFIDCKIIAIKTSDIDQLANRPKFSILKNIKLNKILQNEKLWEDTFNHFLRK